MEKILLISPCHYRFGGWYRAYNIAKRLPSTFLYSYKQSFVLRLLTGVKNCWYVLWAKKIIIFEIVQPETLFSALFGKLLGKKVIVDVADEWLYSPTYLHSNFLKRFLIRFLDTQLIKLFPITVTSTYLQTKYKRGFKLINGVDRQEFELVSRNEARKRLNIGYDDKILLAFGNTWGNQRTFLLNNTFNWVKIYDSDVKLFFGNGWDKKKLSLYLGACDLVLFPTGDEPCEKACFPIRVGTCLNAERVIATDSSDTEFHSTLKDCLVLGKEPEELSQNIILFFKDRSYRKKLEENVKKAKQRLDWDVLVRGYEDFFKTL